MTRSGTRPGARRLAASLFAFALSTGPAAAEPYLAVRTGHACSQCHVNRTGGGQRNDFGTIYAQSHLYMALLRPEGGPSFADGRIGDRVTIGADLRAANVSTLAYEAPSGAVAPSSNASSITRANVYAHVELEPGVVSLYLDQILAPQSTNREIFALVSNRAQTLFAKVGRMILPYGLRIVDDGAFIRSRTGYSYNRHDVALEIGAEPGPIAAVVNVTDNQLSGQASIVHRRGRIGVSGARSTTRGEERVFGAFAGLNVGRVTLLGEIDRIERGDLAQVATLAELDFLLTRGLNAKVVHEIFDRNRDVPLDRDGQERWTFGVEPFVTRFFQLALFYRLNAFVPESPAGNQDVLTIEAHAFF